MIRPRLYALLVDPPLGPRRRLFYRGEEHEEPVPESICSLPARTPVLLAGAPGRWDSGAPVRFIVWNRPAVSALREGRLIRKPIALEGVRRTQWAVDSEGRPCELGDHQSSEDGRVVVVNYAGWWLTELEKVSIEVVVSEVGDQKYYIVPASAVDILCGISEPDPSRLTPPPAPENAPVKAVESVRAPFTRVPPAMQSTPHGTPVDRVIPIDEVIFGDGQIGVVLRHNELTWIAEMRARKEFDAIKRDLKKHVPQGLRIVGTFHSDGHHALEIRHLEGLDCVFKKAEQTAYLHRITTEGRWISEEELTSALGETLGDTRPLDGVLTIPQLGFDRRTQAFARLFRLYDTRRRVRLQPNRAMLIPIKATDGGADWWVWELVEYGNATYLFRPQSRDMEQRLFDWLGQADISRRHLLENRELQHHIGYQDRVIHHAGAEDLESWWRDIRRQLGQASKD